MKSAAISLTAPAIETPFLSTVAADLVTYIRSRKLTRPVVPKARHFVMVDEPAVVYGKFDRFLASQ